MTDTNTEQISPNESYTSKEIDEFQVLTTVMSTAYRELASKGPIDIERRRDLALDLMECAQRKGRMQEKFGFRSMGYDVGNLITEDLQRQHFDIETDPSIKIQVSDLPVFSKEDVLIKKGKVIPVIER